MRESFYGWVNEKRKIGESKSDSPSGTSFSRRAYYYGRGQFRWRMERLSLQARLASSLKRLFHLTVHKKSRINPLRREKKAQNLEP